MVLTYDTSIFINQEDGKFNIKIKDTSNWPVSGINRQDIALAFVVHKIDLIGTPPTELPLVVPLDARFGGRVITNSGLTNATRTEVDFIVGNDGYHRTYMFALPLTPTDIDGDYYYDPSCEGDVKHRVDGVYIRKSLEQAIEEGFITEVNRKEFPANPKLSVKLDSIAEKYSKGRSGSSDPDFKLWTVLYIQLYGALLSFDKQAYFDYERKVRAANKMY
jgi:hypothetical protein